MQVVVSVAHRLVVLCMTNKSPSPGVLIKRVPDFWDTTHWLVRILALFFPSATPLKTALLLICWNNGILL